MCLEEGFRERKKNEKKSHPISSTGIVTLRKPFFKPTMSTAMRLEETNLFGVGHTQNKMLHLKPLYG